MLGIVTSQVLSVLGVCCFFLLLPLCWQSYKFNYHEKALLANFPTFSRVGGFLGLIQHWFLFPDLSVRVYCFQSHQSRLLPVNRFFSEIFSTMWCKVFTCLQLNFPQCTKTKQKSCEWEMLYNFTWRVHLLQIAKTCFKFPLAREVFISAFVGWLTPFPRLTKFVLYKTWTTKCEWGFMGAGVAHKVWLFWPVSQMYGFLFSKCWGSWNDGWLI